MNPIIVSPQGHSWIYSNKGLQSADDPTIESEISKEEIRFLYSHYRHVWYIRYVSSFDKVVSSNYWYVLRSEGYSLPSKTRNQIRKCLKSCIVRRVTGEEMVQYGGYCVYMDEMNRYREKGMLNTRILSKSEFAHWMENEVQDLWAVFNEDRIIAYMICRHVGKCINLVI